VAAFAGLSTRRVSGATAGVTLPSSAMVCLIRCGWMYVPLLAIAVYPAAIWISVASTLCPTGIAPEPEALHSFGSSTRPEASPGSPSPVALPRPNFFW
jgi:hypothetical protein